MSSYQSDRQPDSGPKDALDKVLQAMSSHHSDRQLDSSLKDSFEKVLQFQLKWNSLNTPEMKERGQIIREGIPQTIHKIASADSKFKTIGFRVEGGDGAGRKTKVPWVRIYLPNHSPKATIGWYVVYLFSYDGSAVFLSLNQGTTDLSNGARLAKPREEILQRVNKARTELSDSVRSIEGLHETIQLKDHRGLGEEYEYGNVYAFKYTRGNIPDTNQLVNDMDTMLGLLNNLYTSETRQAPEEVYWFVGASFNSTNDQTARFYEEGIWENGWNNKFADDVKSMRPGDKIAIKAAYTRKHGLPFDNRGQFVSVMAIKAVGSITKNWNDGRKVSVQWTPLNPQREWYFYTQRGTLWRVLPGNWMNDALIAFAFKGEKQNYTRFLNEPYWLARYGDIPLEERKFQWVPFYQAVADKLLTYRNKRSDLIKGLNTIAQRVPKLGSLDDRFSDGTTGILKDICPFTTIGLFNRGITDDNRRLIAQELAEFLGVKETIPDSFEGIPVLHNLKSRFFGFQKDRQPDDIDALWDIFATAIKYADSEALEDQFNFIKAYDNANGRLCINWNLTCGLYWIRPMSFLSLDNKSKFYINDAMKLKIDLNGPKNRVGGLDYCILMDELEGLFKASDSYVRSFPELSLAAWKYNKIIPAIPEDTDGDLSSEEGDQKPLNGPLPVVLPYAHYSLEDIVGDGCFVELKSLETIMNLLKTKKNVILQGPPGTGKTWLANRLAYALVGYKDFKKTRSVQFHPNLSYEDFIRGWRPSSDGKLKLVDGPFIEMIKTASQDPASKYVIVIEEINRGNPAQIFGEMLTLLEADRRSSENAIELCYKIDIERIFIPDNLYVIGTMNIADRSLALVDFALRRRFAFFELEPNIGETWRKWVTSQCKIDPEIAKEIESRLLKMNEEIKVDTNLGKQFCIGHSYVTPSKGAEINDHREWFRNVVKTEIGPLLDEYWFDSPEKAQKARRQLVEGF